MTYDIDIEQMLLYFRYEHLPEHLRSLSKPVCELAFSMAALLDSREGIVIEETTVGLRKLLEAKDCFVRAGLNL
jgi:hypothetical protein